MSLTVASKNSTGVFVMDIHNSPYELTEYNLFVQKQCEILKKKNKHFDGKGNTLIYIAELWQKKKAKEAKRKTEKKPSTPTVVKKPFSSDYHLRHDELGRLLKAMGEKENLDFETLEMKEDRYKKAIAKERVKAKIAIKVKKEPTTFSNIPSPSLEYINRYEELGKSLKALGKEAHINFESLENKEERFKNAMEEYKKAYNLIKIEYISTAPEMRKLGVQV
jgi:hypothetical protein